jgi:hypothetical protein
MIGGTLEYLMSSLPHLSFQNTDETKERVIGLLEKYAGTFDQKVSPAELLDREAKKFLSASRYAIFQKINLNTIHAHEFQKSSSEVIAAYSSFTDELKRDVTLWRTLKEDGDKSIKNKVEKIIGEGNPLEKEIRIMKYQWEKLETLSKEHFSDFEALVTYKIKLLILLRMWSFDADKGMKNYIRLTINNRHG